MNGARVEIRRVIAALLVIALVQCAAPSRAEDVSQPAILQWFEATYDTMEKRSPDMFLAGYGRAYTPPPGRADLSNSSVGYDVYDRFDLGKPNSATLYGTETGLKQFASVLHRFDGRLDIDAVLNHNAYSDNDYVNPQFTQFQQAGGYPGFVLQNPDGGADPAGVSGTFGDFHNPAYGGDYLNGQLSGLLDIDHSTNWQLIRQPVAAGDPQNIPAGVTPWVGRLANVPNPANARFYPDRDSPGATYFDPVTNQNVTVYPFNTANPTAGDAVPENALGLEMRYLQWMVQTVGVDGFRLDAAKHMPQFALKYFDTAVYRSNPRLQLDGSVENVFMYGEVVPGDGQPAGMSSQDFLYSYVRKDINPATPNVIGGDRDVLDFVLRGNLSANLSNNATGNDWRNVVNSSIDVRDDGLHNGSAGVMFVSNHDGGGADMSNVAHAYILTQPGNAIVYYNAKQFGTGRSFPVDGRGDALGNYGDSITDLLSIRETHGRGDYRERWLEKEYFAMERSKSMLVLLDNRNDAGVSPVKTMDVDFLPGQHLVELTGNAAANGLPQAITVQNVAGHGSVSVQFLNNNGQDKGYLVYGLQTPQSTAGLTITNQNGSLAGGNPPANDVVANAKTRLATLPIVTANTINVRLDTQAVTLSDGFRDTDADGDNAVLKVNQGVDTNGNGHIDYTTPGSAVYGFEEFAAANKSAGYGSPTGNGWYQQAIDATNLPEGYNFITVRAFRHRSDGGPAVFTDFKKVVYLDRVAPPAAVVSFAPYASDPNNPNNRDLIVKSVDATANNMHFFLDLPVNLTNTQILAMVGSGSQANAYDRDQWIRGWSNINYGNHVATVVTYEPTGNYNIQRFSGLFTATNARGAGFGDMNFSNGYVVGDIRANVGSVEDVLYSQNAKYSSAFDVNGDGLCDNRDLFLLGDELVAHGASQAVLNSYTDLLLKRGDANSSGVTDAADVATLYASFGTPTWQTDLNVDGVVNIEDVKTLVTNDFRTVAGDFNLDGMVDGSDYVLWRKNFGQSGATFLQGDATFDGVIGPDDLALWRANFGFVRQPLGASGSGVSLPAVPEPAALWLTIVGFACAIAQRQRTKCS